MKTLIKIILSLFALTLIASSCGGDSYAKRLDKEKANIKKFIAENDLNIVTTYPVVFGEKDFYHDLKNNVYFQVVDSGLGEKARAYIAPGNINARSGTDVSIRYDSAHYLMDQAKDSIVYFDSRNFETTFTYGQSSTYERSEEPYDFMSTAIVLPLEYVREGALVRMIIPFNSGSPFQQLSYNPAYIHLLRYQSFRTKN